MSNREIIEWLKKKAEAVPMPGARKMYEAAAKALEAAQPELGTNLAEVGTDCISRQQAIDAIEAEKIKHGDYLTSSYVGYEFAKDAIRKLPPIQSAEPKRGRWHYSDGKPARIGLSFGVICDQCGTESEYCTNFCGECGADMRGEQNG